MALLNILVLLILLSWTFALAFLLMTLLALQLRARKIHKLRLRPNCLLTRAPLVFITGPRSFFYFMQYWSLIPRFMYEHGYLVEVWRLPWSNPNLQRGTLLKRLKKHADRGGLPLHLFYDASMKDLINEVCVASPSLIASVTETNSLLHPAPMVAPAFGADRWIKFGFDLHARITRRAATSTSIGLGQTTPAWQIETRILDRAVDLAEAEITNS